MKVYGTTLATYTNNLFVTYDNMDTALARATELANGSDNSAALLTAVYSVLNTAIKLHQSDMAKANAPLLEMIDARIASAMDDVHYAIETNMRTVDDKIQTAIDDLDVDQKVQDWMDSNFDLESALSGVSVRINFD
jgi:hypothetical protein